MAAQRHSSRVQTPRRDNRRQEAPAIAGSAAPLSSYGAAPVSDYGVGADSALEALARNVPGVPGDDYPIFAEVPESAFTCDNKLDGGFYADPEANCQSFHICTTDGHSGLTKYSFLCPNGTIFNQNYFICDWWFNFDCSTAETLFSKNEEIAAERDSASAAAFDQTSYGAPPPSAPSAYTYGAPSPSASSLSAFGAPSPPSVTSYRVSSPPSATSFRSPSATSFRAPSSTSFGSPYATSFGSTSATSFGAPSATSLRSPSATSFGAPSATSFGSPSATSFGSTSATSFGAHSATSFSSPSATSFGAPSSFGSSAYSSGASNAGSFSSTGYVPPAAQGGKNVYRVNRKVENRNNRKGKQTHG